jgi:2-C-methyl-D-erythritol 2,4-cyclodiphosphate synthase
MKKIRTGLGFDVHVLEQGRDFWLGGVKIDHNKGAVGHSDADVLIHAVCDALLGAASLGDIGIHFPNTDEKYKGIDSKILLKETVLLLEKKGYKIGNIDITLLLEKPKISPYIPKMIAILSGVMGIEQEDLSIKATTTETLGYEGREEGVSCMASALIYQI